MIHRAKHENNFLRVDYSTVRDETLSFEARGLLIYLLTMADSWEFSIKGIAKQTGKSERSVMRITKELKDAGYIIQEKRKDTKGHFNSYEWHVYEIPELRKNGSSGKTHLGTELHENRTTANPNYRKSAPIRTNNIKELTNSKNKQLVKEKYKRKPLGIKENIMLTDEELQELREELGTNDAGRYIDLLSFYLKDHPETKYKSHYETIKRWYERDQKEKRPDITPLNDPEVDWVEIKDTPEESKKQ